MTLYNDVKLVCTRHLYKNVLFTITDINLGYLQEKSETCITDHIKSINLLEDGEQESLI